MAINFAETTIPGVKAQQGAFIPEDVKRQLLAAQLLQQTASDTQQPVYSKSLGLAKLLSGGLGGFMQGYTDAQEKAAQKDAYANYAKALMPSVAGGAASAPPAPVVADAGSSAGISGMLGKLLSGDASPPDAGAGGDISTAPQMASAAPPAQPMSFAPTDLAAGLQGQSLPSQQPPAAPSPAPVAAINAAAPQGGMAYAPAISGIESAGSKDPYSLLGPVTKSGDRAYGKYQVMGNNVAPWTKEVLGQEMSPADFASNPQAQDAVFNAKFGALAQKYGPEGAARAWFAGEGGMNDPNRKDILGTTVAGYAQKFNALNGGQTAQAQPIPNAEPASPVAQPVQQGTPPAPQPPAGRGVASSIDPQAVMQLIQDPRIPPEMKQYALQQLQPQYELKTRPDGTTIAIDARNPANKPIIVDQTPAKPEFKQTGEDMFGNKQFNFVDAANKKVFDQNGNPVPANGASAAGGGTASGYLAKGVTAVDNSLMGTDYLNQFSPEVQAAVLDYRDGKSMPTGNPRAGYTQAIKMIAQKFGNDTGMPADDTTFAARRQMRTELSKGTPGSLGGQITFGGTSLGHLADVAEKATKLGNSSGFGIAPLAQVFNNVRGATTEQAAKVNEVSGAVQHYGQEITKFYTGSPGGEGERMRFLNTINTSKSPEEISGAIRTERDLIPDRINQIAGQISQQLGPEEAQKYLSRANIAGSVAKINASLVKLDPTGPEAKMAAANGQPQAGTPASQAAPPIPNAKQAPDGNWYVPDPNRAGKYMQVVH